MESSSVFLRLKLYVKIMIVRMYYMMYQNVHVFILLKCTCIYLIKHLIFRNEYSTLMC